MRELMPHVSPRRRAALEPTPDPTFPSRLVMNSCEPLESRRLLADVGIALDTTFGDGGRALTDVGPRDIASDVARLADGRFVVAGASGEAVPDADWRAQGLVARFNPDGSRDPTFDGDGIATLPTGWTDGHLVLNALVTLPDGKLLVGGYRAHPSTGPVFYTVRDVVLARFNPDGSLDPSFGTGGVAYPVPQAQLYDLVALPDGKFLAGGYRMSDDQATPLAALWRFNGDGSLDATFGDNGQLLHGTPQNGLAHVEKLLVRPDGTINGTLNGVLVTFNPDGSLARPIHDPTAWIHGDT